MSREQLLWFLYYVILRTELVIAQTRRFLRGFQNDN